MERKAKQSKAQSHKARQSKWVSSNKGRKQQQKSKTHPKHMCNKSTNKSTNKGTKKKVSK
jgi:hypothetical protein